MATYKIHPGIGIARLGNSETEFYLAPETPAGLPLACDANGNTLLSRTGDAGAGQQIPRRGRPHQASGRAISGFVYDEERPEGRPLKLGDPVEGGGNNGTLIDIQWRVYLANKKACWYQFNDHARRTRLSADASAPQRRV